MPPKKVSRRTKADKPPRTIAKKRAATRTANRSASKTLEALRRELAESLQQQAATSEILRVMASSPVDIQPVLDTVAANAARLCDATDAAIWRSDKDKFWLIASHGSIPIHRGDEVRPMTRLGLWQGNDRPRDHPHP